MTTIANSMAVMLSASELIHCRMYDSINDNVGKSELASAARLATSMHIIHTLVATTNNLAADRYVFYYKTISLLAWIYA